MYFDFPSTTCEGRNGYSGSIKATGVFVLFIALFGQQVFRMIVFYRDSV